MELAFSLLTGAITAAGVALLLRGDRFRVVLGIGLLGYAANLFIMASGGMLVGRPPLMDVTTDPARAADPLPQALVLTAIVIGFGMLAWLIALALRAGAETREGKPSSKEPGS